MPPRNRKERRAAAASAASAESFDPSSIPMARPSTSDFASRKNMKTLLEIAAERQTGAGIAETEFIHVSPSGEILETETLSNPSDSAKAPETEDDADETNEDDTAIPPLPDTIFLALPLSALYFTLSFLAAHQYAQDIPIKKLIRDTVFVAFPVLTFLVHFAHGHIISFESLNVFGNKAIEKNKAAGKLGADQPMSLKSLFPLMPRNIIFCAMAILLGMRLIKMTNEGSYYAVMKKAPSVGTLWVWSVLELPLGLAILGLLIPVIWATGFKGYGII
ncbi:hypothetical protein PRK78_006550 [Emydomyces testavorans]|uniref:DUF7719 domain-containing protein n=1 Tax=Emydomyces testavorans TaxID=2070801 RepID=A0AAF0ILT1_9EURO|nr:hypothetical protein PRK78_006550 [Emydomyces testavorans]